MDNDLPAIERGSTVGVSMGFDLLERLDSVDREPEWAKGGNDWARWDLPMLWEIHHALDEDPERPHHVRLSQLVPILGIHRTTSPGSTAQSSA